MVRENNSEVAPGPHARMEKINSISSLLETREGFGLDSLGSLGLGFRAAMPKMPSFRKVGNAFIVLIYLLLFILLFT